MLCLDLKIVLLKHAMHVLKIVRPVKKTLLNINIFPITLSAPRGVSSLGRVVVPTPINLPMTYDLCLLVEKLKENSFFGKFFPEINIQPILV